ncbi:RrF2 family transcriptional regulator [Salinarimonas rosea]|uniref:RrF2 family transcriptional regulator n=1 Tax=Salinarimonas rosea TaxID=552063 RepID=UPI00040D8E16|nr:Rrf2 family transcriptional regulator [Salinarimonas rosea]
MKLTLHTDYALRVLMTLTLLQDRVVTIDELARRHRVSENHLRKVAQSLGALGLVAGLRGRAGGLRLAVDPRRVRMGGIVRALEDDPGLVACLGDAPAACVLSGACRLTGALARALDAFYAELDRLTLADLVGSAPAMRARLGLADADAS